MEHTFCHAMQCPFKHNIFLPSIPSISIIYHFILLRVVLILAHVFNDRHSTISRDFYSNEYLSS